jgi:prepilin-type N-terminal cleavage/methylation domain-containing protein
VRRRGFSLLELSLVMTIVGIVVALGVPKFLRFRSLASVRGATNEVAAAFAAARQEAITRRAVITVAIDTSAGFVEVRTSGTAILRRSVELRYGVVLGANRDSVAFDPRGLGYGVSNLTLTVRRDAIVDTLTMSRLGRVRW